jgi:hypothetical protein
MYALLSSSACSLGNLELSKEFFQIARHYAGKTFDVIDYRVGCGFVLMSYYSMCQADYEHSVHYINIARTIAEDGLKAFQTDLHINVLLGTAFTQNNYEKRMNMFKEIGNGSTIGDQIFSLVGQVETEVTFNDAPNFISLIEMLMQAYNLEQATFEEDTPNAMLHKVLIYGTLIKTLRRAKLPEMALHYAKFLLRLIEDKNFVYCCVGVSTIALESISNLLLDQNLIDDLYKVLHVIDILSKRYKLIQLVRNTVVKRFSELFPQDAKKYEQQQHSSNSLTNANIEELQPNEVTPQL